VILGFRGAFRRILIVGAVFHESTSNNNSDETSLVLSLSEKYSNNVGDVNRSLGI
jgi:hypothetical protein